MGRPGDRIGLSDPQGLLASATLRRGWLHGDAVLLDFTDRVARFRLEDGFFLAQWPPTEAVAPQSGCDLHGDTLLVCDNRHLTALFAQTLAPRWQIPLAGLLSPGTDAHRALLGSDPRHGACLLLDTGERWEAIRIFAEHGADHPAQDRSRRRLNLPQPPAQVACMGDVLLVSAGQALHAFEWEEATPGGSLELGHEAGRVFPSPDDRHLVVTSDGSHRVSLLRLDRQPLALTRILEGMYVPPRDEHAGGWLFWDQADPKVPGSKPLREPALAWLADGRAAVLATAEGEAVLLIPALPSAVKLMVPPSEALWPLGFSPPDLLMARQNDALRSFRLDWEFGESDGPAPDTERDAHQPPAESEPTPPDAQDYDERTIRRPPPLWLLPAALLAAGLAFFLLRWLAQT